MKKLRLAVMAFVAPALIASYPWLGGAAAQAQTSVAPRREKQRAVEDQIEQLRQQLQSQIDELKRELAGKDEQLQQAQQAAKAAQSAADKATNDQQQAASQNASAVSALQSSVNEMKSSSSSMQSSFTSIQKDTTEIKKAVTEPDAIHFKGITLSPTGSYLAAETVWRQGAVGGGINTPLTGVPLNNSDLA